MKKSMIVFALIFSVLLSSCSSANYNSSGVGCYVLNDESTEVKTAPTNFCKPSRFEQVYTAK